MADFEHEQLKSLFERLAERLDKTAGDEEHLAMLAALRASINKLQKNMNKPDRGGRHGDTNTLLADFVKDLQGKQEGLRGKASPGGSRGTLLDEYTRDTQITENKTRERGAEIMKGLNAKFKDVSANLINFDQGLNGSVAGLAGMIGLSGAGSQKLFGAIDNNIDMYQRLRQTGESSVSGIFDMRRAAADAALTTKQFSEAMVNGSDGLRLLGAIRFADINRRFREASASVGRFGMSIDDTIKFQSTYMQMLTDAGVAKQMSDGQIAAGMESLVRSGNITASILGKTREEVLKERAEASKDANVALSLRGQGMDPAQIQAIVAQLGDIKTTMGPDMARAVRDYVTTGQFQGENATKMAHTPEHANLAMAIGNAMRSGDPLAMQEIARRNEEIVGSMDSTRLEILGALGSLDGNTFGSMNELIASGLKTNSEKADDGAETESDAIQAAAFQETMARLQAAFQNMFTKVLEPLIINHGPKLINFLNNATTWLEKMTSSTQGLWTIFGVVVGGMVAVKVAFGLMHLLIARTLMGSLGLFGNALRGLATGLPAMFGRVFSMFGVRAAGGAAAAAGGAALAVGAGVVGGGAGMFVGNRLVAGNSGESLMGNEEGEGGFLSSRGAGYGASAAGGALAGAAIGSVVPILGTAIGAAIGGVIGLGAAGVQDYMSHRNRPENTISPENRQRNQQRAPGNTQADGAAAPGARTNRTTPEMINQRIASLTEAGNAQLRLIVENNRIQLEVMRQEMAEARNFYAASLRLNEDNNRALRQMGAVS